MKIQSYKELIVWQKGMDLVVAVFKLTDSFPKSELYGIVSQIRRAVVSIPSNVAEAWGRRSIKEYHQFYSIAYGSALELETQLLLSERLKFGNSSDYQYIYSLLNEICKMLHVMSFDLKTKNYDLSTKN